MLDFIVRFLMMNYRIGTEDYTDWESVDEEAEPEPPSRANGKRKTASIKKEDENTGVPPVPESKDNVIEAKKKQSKITTKAKPQKGLLKFFGPKKY